MLTTINHTTSFSTNPFSSSSYLFADVSPYTSVSSSSVPSAMDWSPDDVEMADPSFGPMDWDWDTAGPMDWSPDDVEMADPSFGPMDWSPDDVEMADWAAGEYTRIVLLYAQKNQKTK